MAKDLRTQGGELADAVLEAAEMLDNVASRLSSAAMKLRGIVESVRNRRLTAASNPPRKRLRRRGKEAS
jgi:hypothetical protein